MRALAEAHRHSVSLEGSLKRISESGRLSFWGGMANIGYAAVTIYLGLSLVLALLFAFLVMIGLPIFAAITLAHHHMLFTFQ